MKNNPIVTHYAIRVDLENKGDLPYAVPARKWGTSGYELMPEGGNKHRITNGEFCATPAEALRRRIAWREVKVDELQRQMDSQNAFIAAAQILLKKLEGRS